MLRKNIRLRKEYLYNKDKELKERATLEKKLKLKDAIDNDKPIPFELRKEEQELRHQLENDDVNTLNYEGKSGGAIAQRSHVDDEYEEAKYKDPKVMVTTSRDPSSRLMNFQKVML